MFCNCHPSTKLKLLFFWRSIKYEFIPLPNCKFSRKAFLQFDIDNIGKQRVVIDMHFHRQNDNNSRAVGEYTHTERVVLSCEKAKEFCGEWIDEDLILKMGGVLTLRIAFQRVGPFYYQDQL